MRRQDVAVELVLDRVDAVLERLYPNGKLGGLTLDGAPPGALGIRVQLTIRAGQPSPTHFIVPTQLAWARRKSSKGLKESYGLDFLPDEVSARDRLLAFARGRLSGDLQRVQERLSVALPAVLIVGDAEHRDALVDLSLGGAFFRTDRPLPVGTRGELVFRPPRALTRLRLPAQVTWRRVGRDAPGMGLRFEFGDSRQAERVASLVARLGTARASRG